MLVAESEVVEQKPLIRGYIVDNKTGRTVWRCSHRHGSRMQAQDCAEKQVRLMREKIAGKKR